MSKPEEIRSINQMGTPFLNALFYSEPGVGKTPFIATSEKALILDADSGLANAALSQANCDVWSVEGHQDLYGSLEYLRHEDHPYKWVWLDGMTIYQEKGLEEVMEDLVAVKKHRDIDLPDRGEYRLNYGRILRWVRHMVALPVNFGITAHVMVDEDYDMHVPLIAGHGRNGPMWTKVCGYVDVVGYLRTAETKSGEKAWILHTERDFKDYYARDRYGIIGKMVRPTIPKIEGLVLAHKAKGKKSVRKKKATQRRRRSA